MSRPTVFTRIAAVVAVGAAAAALSACGGDSVDAESLEAGLLDLASQTADVESASCPDDISPDTGTEFECTVVNSAGDDVPVVSVITGTEGDDVLFEVKTIDGVDVSGVGTE